MGRLKFSIHPLFFIFGLYFALTGKVFSFLVYTITAVIHELGHYYQSERVGLTLDKITLMPYGAIIKGDIEGVSYKDECLIAISGPITNFLICIVFVALWWVFPASYPYTELAVNANFFLGVINLLPCFPLDGGRLLLATLSLLFKRKTAKKIVKALGLALAVLLFALFIYSCFNALNYTILFFSLFMFIGTIGGHSDGEYVKIYEKFTYKEPIKPQKIKSVAIEGSATLSEVYKFLGDGYLQVTVLSNNSKVLLEGKSLYQILTENSGNKTFNEVIK